MSEKTSITVSSINGNTKTTKSITDINPNASDAELITLTNALYAMTTNSVSSASKVTKRDIVADGLYQLQVTGTVGTDSTAVTKVDDCNYNVNITTLYADSEVEFVNFTFKINNVTQSELVSKAQVDILVKYGNEGSYMSPIIVPSADSNETVFGVLMMLPYKDTLTVNDYIEGTVRLIIPAGTSGNYQYGECIINFNFAKGA